MILSLLLLHDTGFIKAYNVFNKIAGKFHYFLVTGAAALKRQDSNNVSGPQIYPLVLLNVWKMYTQKLYKIKCVHKHLDS